MNCVECGKYGSNTFTCARCVEVECNQLEQRAEKAEREVLSLKADVEHQRGMSEYHHSLACDYADERNEERERAEKAEAMVAELVGALATLAALSTCATSTLIARSVLAKVGK